MIENMLYFFSENIERFGINYLLQRLPSDQKKFPNIAKKRKLSDNMIFIDLLC